MPFPYRRFPMGRYRRGAVRRRAAEMLLEAELSGQGLAETVIELLTERKRLEQMRANAFSIAKPFAAEEIVGRILALLK